MSNNVVLNKEDLLNTTFLSSDEVSLPANSLKLFVKDCEEAHIRTSSRLEAALDKIEAMEAMIVLREKESILLARELKDITDSLKEANYKLDLANTFAASRKKQAGIDSLTANRTYKIDLHV